MTTTTMTHAKKIAKLALQAYGTHKDFTAGEWLRALSMIKTDELVKQEYNKLINRA
ncbi:MAG: hypothetical protein KAH01_04805 [Caldisericia bacterium]|nr:hypothetical protein [Caldisericia bacterium]